MDAENHTAGDPAVALPDDLPDEVLADLKNLIDAIHEEGPTGPSASLPKVAARDSVPSGADSLTVPQATAKAPTADKPDKPEKVNKLNKADKPDKDVAASSTPSTPRAPSAQPVNRSEPDRAVAEPAVSSEPIVDLTSVPRTASVPLPDAWLAGPGGKATRRPGWWLRDNWPFLLAVVFIVLGVVLILLVLTSN